MRVDALKARDERGTQNTNFGESYLFFEAYDPKEKERERHGKDREPKERKEEKEKNREG